MSLEILVEKATNLPNVESFSKSDPYVTIDFQGIKKKTEVKKGDLNPEWNEKVKFDLAGQPLNTGDKLDIQVKDWELIGRNRLLGQLSIHLQPLLIGSHSMEIQRQLFDGNKRQTQSQLNLKLSYTPPTIAKISKSQADIQSDGTVINLHAENDQNVIDNIDAGDQGLDKDATSLEPTDTGGSHVSKRFHRRSTQNIPGPLSTKPQDFQVKVKVLEARQLFGNNIHPVCRISIGNIMKQTTVRRSTNCPYWNEIFYFNYVISPAELLEEMIEFQVFNSKTFRCDAPIGSFKLDLRLVHRQQFHSFFNKWLLLYDPNDLMVGVKGYLKMSVSVLGPGDEVPVILSTSKGDDEDIESNLLRPAGVELRPATFCLKVYKAEDIPRMDSGFMQGVKKILRIGEEQKELVDPYLVFLFAGKEIRTSIMYCNDHPEWNQQINLGLKFPSMCENIKLILMDWDRVTDDDTIGTVSIPISHISAVGEHEKDSEGFLPTFGPCFVNFYGSAREYSDLNNDYEDLNYGRGEGVAYRGRVLVELETTLGELPDVCSQTIDFRDVLKVQPFCRRRRYRLYAAFFNASMLAEIESTVEFEVSIGNYGNKLDEHVIPSSSTTQPTNTVFDGCYYYFLPWNDYKPCVVVSSHWEDISFRLESLNIINRIIEKLESNMVKLELAQKSNLPEHQLRAYLTAMLNDLIWDCGKPLPEPIPGEHLSNDLDKKLLDYRKKELSAIIYHAKLLKDSETDLNEAILEIKDYNTILKNLAVEPQNSIPDVIIWMLCGEKRVAYYRIPANDVLYSSDEEKRGRLCGKLQTMFMRYPGAKSLTDQDIPALLQVKIWFGLERDEDDWHKCHTEGELTILAETYENQVSILGKWTTKGPTMMRPKWSDITGKIALPKENFLSPIGWKFEGDWYVSPEMSLLYDRDAGHRRFMEDVFENEFRLPGQPWKPATIMWTDLRGDATTPKDEISLPEGWKWTDDEWQVDLNRAVDEEGWEYTVESTLGTMGYGPVEKTYHLCRRRRLVRTRTLVLDLKSKEDIEHKLTEAAEGWEYSALFSMKFHAKERKTDLVRRRRWHKKMVAEASGGPAIFNLETMKADEKVNIMIAPRLFLSCQKSCKYQLRAYIYQARNLLAGDSTGLSDPFARIACLTQSQVTENVKKTLCPTWDQTLIFEEIEIHGEPDLVKEQPPTIVIEIYDHDNYGSPEFLGRTKAYPMVKLNAADTRISELKWYELKRGVEDGGELLASFELFLLDNTKLPVLPPKRGNLLMVPGIIRPIMQRTAIEVLVWGVRNMKKFQMAAVLSPSVEIECGGQVLQTKPIQNTKKNPNFDDPNLLFDIMLPKKELYMPSLVIKVRDNRQFGRKPAIGVHVLKSLEQFRCDALPSIEGDEDASRNAFDHVIEISEDETDESKKPKIPEIEEEAIDWWSKYFASINDIQKSKQYLEKGYEKLEVIPTELEKYKHYNGFTDFCQSFPLYRGKNAEEEESETVGEVKAIFRLYPLPDDPNIPMPATKMKWQPLTNMEECLVRVYIVQAYDLQPKDTNGLADPYIQIKLGRTHVDSRDQYRPNCVNPVFGHMFEMSAIIPAEKDLRIIVKDFDLVTKDDVIGETVIDLENRYLSKFRATCGLPKMYNISGPNKWRDSQKPRQILEEYCRRNNLAAPKYNGCSYITIGEKTYFLPNFETDVIKHPHLGSDEERLALYTLHSLQLVPEHVETRPLYSPLQPGLEQGKLVMWVDLFPKSIGIPGNPVDISIRQSKKYILRCIIWNTKDVVLDETSITGDKMSDIYIKGWILGIDEKQKTDVHYRSLDGEGNFNWRFVFPFNYLAAEQLIEIKKKEHFWSLDKKSNYIPPTLMIQVWDNDKFSPDDFLGQIPLNLYSMPEPAKSSSSCSLTQLMENDTSSNNKPKKKASLFEQKRMYGWWPCYAYDSGNQKLTGKIEMELEILKEEEADQRPAGQGREEPNMNPKLEPPKRPATSFLWFASPWKTFRHIIWRHYKWVIIGLIILILVLILLGVFIYSIPEVAVYKMFDTKKA